MARLSRSDWPPKPDAVLNALRICRDAMTDVHSKVKINGPVYHAASMVNAAVDAMTTLLTGDPQYFCAQGSAMTDQQRDVLQEKELKRARTRNGICDLLRRSGVHAEC